MGQVFRVANGQTIQVRTGVLQGIGPIGPRGLKGDKGDQGDTGPQGGTGPAGSISSYLSVARVTDTTSIGPNETKLVPFSTIDLDELGSFNSSTVIQPDDVGDYLINVWVQFLQPANGGDGFRALELRDSTGVVIARNQLPAVPASSTYLALNTAVRTVSPRTYSVYAQSTDDLAVGLSSGRIAITRTGAGLRGEAGPQGPTGPVGPAGPQGPQGNPGNASSGFATWEGLRQP